MKGYGTTGMKIHTNGIGHMTKMTATPIHGNKRDKVALNRSPEFKGVIFQIVCFVEI